MGLQSQCCCRWALPGSRDQITHLFSLTHSTYTQTALFWVQGHPGPKWPFSPVGTSKRPLRAWRGPWCW